MVFNRSLVLVGAVALAGCAESPVDRGGEKHAEVPVTQELCAERASDMAQALYKLAYGSSAEFIPTEPEVLSHSVSILRYSVYLEDARTHQDGDACAEACVDRYMSEKYTIAMNAGTCRVKTVTRDGAGQDATENYQSPNTGRCLPSARNAASEAYEISNGRSKTMRAMFIDELLAEGANDRNDVTHVSFESIGHDQPQDGFLVLSEVKGCRVNSMQSFWN